MKFSEFKEQNIANYGFFEAEERSHKEFIRLSFNEFLSAGGNTSWQLNIDEKRLNSYPNFTQKHQICISHAKFQNAFFQFRICCENTTNSLGYRLFTALSPDVLDLVSENIAKSDEIAMILKEGLLAKFSFISKCGWWITDTWRDLYTINKQSESASFIKEIINANFSTSMLEVNELLLSAQNSGELDEIMAKCKTFG
ncbi:MULTISPECIES: effector protein [unclassified Campylobacter]|uniref:effector protein n=1 Tax=unclassified Campylobacter TaxID=2593542 RepID=UPI003D344323